jgi:predicted SAM-dependent methyltransferase
VQSLIGGAIRNRRFQTKPQRLRVKRYLDVGCGANAHSDFINLDFLWHPKVDVCWDVSNGLPFSDGSMQGIYSEHCLEHFSLPAAISLMREFRRLLMPGGTLRIVVPDAELYLRTYVAHMTGNTETSFPFGKSEAFEGMWTPILSVNRLFYHDRESLSGHCVMYDFDLLQTMLLHLGFSWVEKRHFGCGKDPALIIDSQERRVESLYVEAGVT